MESKTLVPLSVRNMFFLLSKRRDKFYVLHAKIDNDGYTDPPLCVCVCVCVWWSMGVDRTFFLIVPGIRVIWCASVSIGNDGNNQQQQRVAIKRRPDDFSRWRRGQQ